MSILLAFLILVYSSILKIEAAYSTETEYDLQRNTGRYIPESPSDATLNNLSSRHYGANKAHFISITPRCVHVVCPCGRGHYRSPSFAVDSKNCAEQVSLGKQFLGLCVMWEKP
jgi:hypothetical protein